MSKATNQPKGIKTIDQDEDFDDEYQRERQGSGVFTYESKLSPAYVKFT